MSDEKNPLAQFQVDLEPDPDLAQKLPNYKQIEETYSLLLQGASVGSLMGLSDETIELLYALAYNLYNSGKYEEAHKIFRGLCHFDGAQQRFWMGYGGCKENLKDYQGAVKAYFQASLMSGGEDPEPIYYAAVCCLKDGKKAQALELLEAMAELGRPGNAHDEDFKARSKDLLNTLTA